jgi:hypothetical protein
MKDSNAHFAMQFLLTLYVMKGGPSMKLKSLEQMNPTTVAIGPWILHHLQALVTHMKKGVFVLWFSKS